MQICSIQRIICLLILTFILSSVAYAQSKSEQIKRLMEHYHKLGRHHGAVLVAQDGEVLYEGGFGLADATWEIKNAPDVKYGVGSVTKMFTALLVMQQYERGALRLDASATKYLSDFPVPIDDRITVEDLLTHRSGLMDYVSDLSLEEYMKRYEHPRAPADSVVADIARRSLEFEPGRRFEYSNTGYVLLGLLLEAVTEKSYCTLLNEEVFIPAGMKESGCIAYEPVVTGMATPYEKDDDVLNHAPFSHAIYADGRIYSTVRDLYRFDKALRSGHLLSSNLQTVMNTSRVKDKWVGDAYGTGLRHFYGYGVQIHRRPGAGITDSVTVVGHEGSYTGWSAMLWRIPEDEIVIAVLNNRSIPPLYIELFDILYERPYELPTEEELTAREHR